MGQNNYRSNPTGLKQIRRPDVTLSVVRDIDSNKIESFSVKNIDLKSYDLPDEAIVSIVAYSTTSELRVPLGKVKNISQPKNISLLKYNNSDFIFRLLIRESSGDLLIATCEHIKVKEEGDDEEGPECLFHIQYEEELGEIPWRLKLENGSRPVIVVNDSQKLDLRARLEREELYLRGLIIPTCLEQSFLYLAENPAPDEDPSHWQNIWNDYLIKNGCDPAADVDEVSDVPEARRWAKEVTEHISETIEFTSGMAKEIKRF